MSLLKTNEIQNYNGSSLTLTASTVSTSAQLNTGGNISVTGSLNVSDDSTTRTNLGLGTIATQDSDSITVTGGTATLGALTVSGSDSGDLVRITQTGSGNALVVEDEANPDSTPFVVDSSGNVGIGTSSPATKLDIIGSISVGAGTVSGPSFTTTGDTNTGIYFPAADTIGFTEGGAEAMRITSSGQLFIGTDGTGMPVEAKSLYVSNGGAAGMEFSPVAISGENRLLSFNRSTSAEAVFTLRASSIKFQTNGTERVVIDSSGNVKINNLSASSDVQTDASKNLITTSDARLKNEIGLITESGIKVIKQIIPKYFSWKNDKNNNQQLGFFAQDIYPVLPEAAPRVLKYTEVGRDENDEPILEQVFDENGNPDYEWGFTDRPIIAMCVKAIQDQQTIIESQQSQIDALTARIESLETT